MFHLIRRFKKIHAERQRHLWIKKKRSIPRSLGPRRRRGRRGGRWRGRWRWRTRRIPPPPPDQPGLRNVGKRIFSVIKWRTRRIPPPPTDQPGLQNVGPRVVIRDVNDHKCPSILKLRYQTDSISKQNENVWNCPSSDRMENRNVYWGSVEFINKI